jgi:hypothetical protein
MCEKTPVLCREIEDLITSADQPNEAQGDAEPLDKLTPEQIEEEIKRRMNRLTKIDGAVAALEIEAREKAVVQAKLAEQKRNGLAHQHKQSGDTSTQPASMRKVAAQAKPEPKAQRNFTDPESRIMKDGASKSFEQAYNAQIAVDAKAQIIVATNLTQQANDVKQLVAVLLMVKHNTGRLPAKVSADAGYFSEENINDQQLKDVKLYVPPGRRQHDDPNSAASARCRTSEVARLMSEKLNSTEGHRVYSRRKVIVEPVFGQIKDGLRFRRFSVRGMGKATAEWNFICAMHNLLKLFRAEVGLTAVMPIASVAPS